MAATTEATASLFDLSVVISPLYLRVDINVRFCIDCTYNVDCQYMDSQMKPPAKKKTAGGEYPETLQMRVNRAFLETLDEWRRLQPDLPSRTESVRRLVEIGVKASTRRNKT
jgi:hypothetical protein